MKIVINYEYLNALKYHELEEELKKHGIESAWRGGKKKEDIIQDALTKLVSIKELVRDGVEEQDIEAQLDVLTAQEQEKVKPDLLDLEIIDAETIIVEKKEVSENKLSKAQLEKVLINIDKNLKFGVSQHRVILLKKRKEVVRLLGK